MAESLVEGWTGDIVYTLKADGAVLDLTGMTVAIVARDAYDNAITLSGTLTVTDASAGEVTFSPAVGDIAKGYSPYYVRWKITDSEGTIVYIPNGEAEQWTIRK